MSDKPKKADNRLKYCLGIIIILFGGLNAYSIWSSSILVYDLQFQKQGYTISSERFAMSPGKYVVVVRYNCKSPGNFMKFYSPTTMNDDGTVGRTYGMQELLPDETRAAVTIDLATIVTNLEIQVLANEPTLQIDEMAYRPLSKQNDPLIFYTGFLLIGLILLLLYRNNKNNNLDKMVICGYLAIITGLTMLPYLNDFLIAGMDLPFHLSRIEGTYQSMLTGQFPVRINVSQLYGFGYASPITYPQLFIYLSALFRLFGLSLLNSYKIMVLIINLLTVVCAYFSFKNIFNLKYAGLIGSTVYLLSIYRLNNIYDRAAIGEALGMAFLPLIFWGIYEIIYRNHRKWLPATIGITGAYQSHLITAEMVLIIIVIVCLISLRRFWVYPFRILAMVKAALLTVLVNLWHILPLLTYLRENFVVFDEDFKNSYRMGEEAVYFSQMFTTFVSGNFQGEQVLSKVRGSTQGEMPLTLGLSLLLGTLLYLTILLVTKIKNSRVKLPAQWIKISNFSLLTAAVLIFMSGWLMSLDLLFKINIIKQIIQSFQFVFRFFSPASLLLSFVTVSGILCAAITLPKYKYLIFGASMTIILLLSIYSIDSTVQYTGYSQTDVMAMAMSADELYLYDRSDRQGLAERGNVVTVSPDARMRFSNFMKNGSRLELTVHRISGTAYSYIEVPLYYYPGYHAAINTEKLALERGTNGVVRIMVPDDTMSGKLEVYFQAPFLWQLGNILSGITVLGFLTYFLLTNKNKSGPREKIAK